MTDGQNSGQNEGWTETAVRMRGGQNSGQNDGWTETATKWVLGSAGFILFEHTVLV